MLDHLMRLSMFFCNRVQSATEFIVQYKRISSAYNLITKVTFKGISFINIEKEGLELFLGGYTGRYNKGVTASSIYNYSLMSVEKIVFNP